MRPIRKELLVNTITLYNITKDENGNDLYLDSVIKRCLCYNKKNTYSVANYTADKQYSLRILIDRRNTYCEDKIYLEPNVWQKTENKNNFFTFQVGDVIVKGVVSEDSEESFDEVDLEKFVIKEVNPIQDKDGTIHSWELICV